MYVYYMYVAEPGEGIAHYPPRLILLKNKPWKAKKIFFFNL